MHRHGYKGRKLSREAGPRKALLRNLVSQVILYESVRTTQVRQKVFRAPGRYWKEIWRHSGGYCRIIKLDNRVGDNAKMAQISLLDTEKLTKKEAEKKPKEKAETKLVSSAAENKKAEKKPTAKKPASSVAEKAKPSPKKTAKAGK